MKKPPSKKTVKASEDIPARAQVNLVLYTSLLTENKRLKAEIEELKMKIVEQDSENFQHKSSREEVLEKLGLRERIKKLFK